MVMHEHSVLLDLDLH